MSTIVCPSGLSGEIRGLTGRDGRYLANPKVVQDNEVEDYILRNCWVSTIESEPYAFGEGKPVDWDKALLGDRVHLFLKIRAETFPDEPYPFKVKCEKCARQFEWQIDIEELLAKKTKLLSPESKEIFKNGNRFEATLPYVGTKFWFRLRVGADQKRDRAYDLQLKQQSKKKQEEANRFVDRIIGSIVEVEGVAKDRKSRCEFFEDLPFRVLHKIPPILEKADCGVETSIEVECVHCDARQMINLPFDRTFFSPPETKEDLPTAEPATSADEE
jgi:hypothetical protein